MKNKGFEWFFIALVMAAMCAALVVSLVYNSKLQSKVKGQEMVINALIEVR